MDARSQNEARARDRPWSQWLFGGGVLILTLGTTILWAGQVAGMLTTCSFGLDNTGVRGYLTGESCVLVRGDHLFAAVPWRDAAWIAGLLALSLGSVLVALFLPRRSRRSHVFAGIGFGTLVLSGCLMLLRAWNRMDGWQRYVLGGTPEGSRWQPGPWRTTWQLVIGERRIVIPEVGSVVYGAGALAGLVFLVLLGLLCVDGLRRGHRGNSARG